MTWALVFCADSRPERREEEYSTGEEEKERGRRGRKRERRGRERTEERGGREGI